MGFFIGTFSLPDQSMIGRWRFYNIFLAFSNPIKLVGLGMIRFLLGVAFLNSYCKAFTNKKLHRA